MLTLSWPAPTKFNYAKNNFGGLENLRRQTAFNLKDFRDYVDRSVFNLEHQHLLVGILHQLAIDPNWDLEYVINYTRFRANSLCTLFKITSINRIGQIHTNGFYRENVREHWALIDNNKEYDESLLSLDSLRPIVPVYTTVLNRGYRHNILKSSAVRNEPSGFALIGLDLVELALGWWLYMKQPREVNMGISAYVCQYPLVTAQLIHNQLTVFNILYEFFVNDKSIEECIITDSVTFNTLSEKRLLREYLVFLADRLTSRKLEDLTHLLVHLKSIYPVPYFYYVSAGNHAHFAQTCWFWELPILKTYELYLTIANRMRYKASDINIVIERVYRTMKNNYQRIPDKYSKQIFLDQLERVYLLNKENMK